MHLRKTVSEPWFTLISMGLKQVEGRLMKGNFTRLETGDVILWENDELGFVYHKYYSEEDERRYGVLALRLSLTW
ncbi:g654 [Coccomyxa elongata]